MDHQVIVTGQSNGPDISLRCTTDALIVSTSGSSELASVPYQNIVSCIVKTEDHVLELFYVDRTRYRGRFALVHIAGPFQEAIDVDDVQTWAKTVTERAYAGVKQGRRLKVVVNPHGGVGKAVEIFEQKVQPILLAAGCTLDATYTTHYQHAFEIAKGLTLDFDAVVCVSGDGLAHEVLNGFAQHQYPARAFSIPIAPIPTGSGNGLSLNVLGMEDGFDVCYAALNVVKGSPMKVDVCSLVQGEKQSLSYMSQAVGLMADLDLGTEHLRWMGDARFVFGYLRGVLQMRSCPVELSFKPAETDKLKMLKALKSHKEPDTSTFTPGDEILPWVKLPRHRYSKDDIEGWTTFDKPILTVFAGKGPYVGRDLMAFPVSAPSDGLLDIAVQEITSRTEMLINMQGAAKGALFWNSHYHYFKAHAYRVRPLTSTGYLSVDGEHFPFEEFQVEVLPRLASLLSMLGRYASDFLDESDDKM